MGSASVERIKVGLLSLLPPAPAPAPSSVSGSVNSSGIPSGQASAILMQRPPGRVVYLGTCSKICAISFVVGVVVGFTLKKRLRRWVVKQLKRLKDD